MLTLEEMGPWTSPGTVPVKRVEPAVAELDLADPNLVIANLDLGRAERSPQHHKTGEDLVESTLSASQQERAGARGPFALLLITSSS